jgi:hypothetical protein
MAIIDKYSPLVNFWEVHPQLTIPSAFKAFWEGDSSDKKEKSSKIMWAVGLVYDYESEYADQVEEDRIALIEEDFLESPKFFEKHKAKLDPLIQTYMKLQEAAPRRAFNEWMEGMDKRTKFLHETPYTVENGSKIDKMRAETGKLMETMDKLKEQYLTKKATTNTEADYIPSLLEQDEL